MHRAVGPNVTFRGAFETLGGLVGCYKLGKTWAREN